MRNQKRTTLRALPTRHLKQTKWRCYKQSEKKTCSIQRSKDEESYRVLNSVETEGEFCSLGKESAGS